MRWLAVVFVMLLASSARADDAAPRIAVVIELAVNVDPARADELGAALADALNRELEVDAFGGTDVSRTLPEGGLPDECLARAECVNDVASRLDAEQLLFLVLIQVGADVQVDASWVDRASGAVSARPRVVLASDARAVSVFADNAKRYLPDAKPRSNTIIVESNGKTVDGGRRMTTPAWITLGVAGAGAIAGSILAVSARKTYDDCDSKAGGCSDKKLDGLKTRALLADVSFVVAACAAITTAILYLRSDSTVTLSPAEQGTGAVIGYAGHF